MAGAASSEAAAPTRMVAALHGWTLTDDAQALPAASQIVRATLRAFTSAQATPKARMYRDAVSKSPSPQER